MAVTIFFRYAAWHYLTAPRLLIGVWKNLLWYLGHIFSVRTLWQSLFTPWKRIVATRTKKWDLEDYASALLANLMSRVIGAVMRFVLIVIGRLLQLGWLVFGIVFYVTWFVLPLLLVLTFGYGLLLII